MKKIGTHNSGTGERPGNLLSWLGWPFARCQGKTLREQYEAGVRYFDLRCATVGPFATLNFRDATFASLRNTPKWGVWHLAHGLWRSSRTLVSVLEEIDSWPELCHVILTYEGKQSDAAFAAFRLMAETLPAQYPKIAWEYFAVKKPKWEIVRRVGKNYPVQGFVPITGWRRLLPVPWVWHFLLSLRYFRCATYGANAPTLDTKKWVLVDFL